MRHDAHDVMVIHSASDMSTELCRSFFLLFCSPTGFKRCIHPHSSGLFHLLIHIQYIPRNMHTVFALLCFVVVIHWLIFPYPSGLLHWHCGNLTIAPVPAKQPWWIWINTLCEFIINDCITTTKQSTTKPCAYFLGYTVGAISSVWSYEVARLFQCKCNKMWFLCLCFILRETSLCVTRTETKRWKL